MNVLNASDNIERLIKIQIKKDRLLAITPKKLFPRGADK